MNEPLTRAFAYFLLLGATLWTNSVSAAPIYHVTDLGNLTGGTSSEALAINDSGQVVGDSTVGNGHSHAFLYSSGTMTDIGTLGGIFSYGQGIGSGGQVVGWSATLTSGNNYHAFVYDGTMHDLGTLGGATSRAISMNAAGQIVGNSVNSIGIDRAFLYSNGIMSDLGALPGGAGSSTAYSINNIGQIVGTSNSPGLNRAVLFSGSSVTDLGALGGGSYALNINNGGNIVGESYLSGNSGTIHAFLYTGGAMYDLNQRLDSSGTSWSLTSAQAINDNGWIVGFGTNPTGQTHAFLLTPLPEPSTFVLAGIAAIGLLAFAYRHRSGMTRSEI